MFKKEQWGNIELEGLSDEELLSKNWTRVAVALEMNASRVKNGWYEKNTERFSDPEYIKKLSEAIKNSEAHKKQKQQLDELRRTTPRSFEANAKNSASQKGRQVSEETRRKISQAQTGKETGRSKPVQTPKGRFDKIQDAATAFGVSPESIKYRIKTRPTEYFFLEGAELYNVRCPIMTPDGPFKDTSAAGDHYNITREAIGYRLKAKPKEYYRITVEEYRALTGKDVV